MSWFNVVDDLLAARFRIGLEELLCDTCLSGRLPLVLADDAKFAANCLHSEMDNDGGQSSTFEGTFTLMQVEYRFRCHIFVEGGGERFLSDVQDFEPVEWRLRFAV